MNPPLYGVRSFDSAPAIAACKALRQAPDGAFVVNPDYPRRRTHWALLRLLPEGWAWDGLVSLLRQQEDAHQAHRARLHVPFRTPAEWDEAPEGRAHEAEVERLAARFCTHGVTDDASWRAFESWEHLTKGRRWRAERWAQRHNRRLTPRLLGVKIVLGQPPAAWAHGAVRLLGDAQRYGAGLTWRDIPSPLVLLDIDAGVVVPTGAAPYAHRAVAALRQAAGLDNVRCVIQLSSRCGLDQTAARGRALFLASEPLTCAQKRILSQRVARVSVDTQPMRPANAWGLPWTIGDDPLDGAKRTWVFNRGEPNIDVSRFDLTVPEYTFDLGGPGADDAELDALCDWRPAPTELARCLQAYDRVKHRELAIQLIDGSAPTCDNTGRRQFAIWAGSALTSVHLRGPAGPNLSWDVMAELYAGWLARCSDGPKQLREANFYGALCTFFRNPLRIKLCREARCRKVIF